MEINALRRAVRDAGVPESPEEAAQLADAATEAAASLRKWAATLLEDHARNRSRRGETAEKSQVFVAFLQHYTALRQQWVALQFQVADLTIGTHAQGDPLLVQRYCTARRAFASDAEMAETLDVHRSQITRWKQGTVPDSENSEKLIGFDVVVSLLDGFLHLETIPKWLRGVNAHLGNRRPIDVLREGRLSDVIRAIEAEKSGAFA